jgi:tape measure domain-containing protein
MATELDNLVVRFTLDGKQAELQAAELRKVFTSLSASANKTGQAVEKLEHNFDGIASGFRRAIITVGAIRFALMDISDVLGPLTTGALKAGGEVERLGLLMRGLSTETNEAMKRIDAMKNTEFVFNLAKSAPFEVKDLADAFVKLKSAGIDPTNGSLKGLVDSVARFGGTSENLKRAAIAIQQMSGKGVISMEELRQQLGEAVPNAMALLAQGMGISMSKLTKLVSDGVVKSEDALSRLSTMMQLVNGGAAQAMMESYVGLVSRMKTEWMLFQNAISEAGFGDAAKNVLRDLIQLFQSTDGRGFAIGIGETLASITNSLRDAARWISEHIGLIKTLAWSYAGFLAAGKFLQVTAALKTFYDLRMSLGVKASEASRAEAVRIAESNLLAQQSLVTRLNAEATAHNAAAAAKTAAYKTQEAVHAAHLARLATLEAAYQAESAAMAARAAGRAPTASGMPWGYGGARGKALQAQGEEVEALRKATQASADHTAELRNGMAASQGIAIATSAHAERQQNLAEKLSTATAMQNGMNRAASFGAGVFAALGGWITVITLALTVGIPMWMQWAGRAEEAIKRVRDAANRGLGGSEEVTTARDNLNAGARSIFKQREEIAVAEAEKERRSKLGINTAELDKGIEAQKQRLNRLLIEQQTLQEDFDKVAAQATVNEANKLAGPATEAIRRQTEAVQLEMGVARSALDAKYKDLAAEIKDPIKREALEAQKQKEFAGISVEGIDKKIAIIDEASAKLREQLDKTAGLSDVQRQNLQQQLAILSDARQGEVNLRKGSQALLNPIDVLTKTDKNGGRAVSAFSPVKEDRDQYDRFLDTQKNLSVKLKNDIAHIEDEIFTRKELDAQAAERIKELIDSGQLKKTDQIAKKNSKGVKEYKQVERKLTGPEIEEARAALADNEYQKLVNQAVKKYTEIQRDGVLQMREAQLVFDNPNSVGTSSVVLQMERTIQELNRYEPLLKEQLAKTGETFESFTTKLRATARTTDIADYYRTMVKANTASSIALVQNDRERNALQTQQEIEAQREILVARTRGYEDRGALTEKESAEYKAAVDQFVIFTNNALAALAIANETPLQKLQRDWMKGFDHLSEMGASWASGFIDMLVDGIAEGSFKIGDFVKKIGTDLLKLTLQETIGKQVIGASQALIDSIRTNLGVGKTGEGNPVNPIRPAGDLTGEASKALLGGVPTSMTAFDGVLSAANATITTFGTSITEAVIALQNFVLTVQAKSAGQDTGGLDSLINGLIAAPGAESAMVMPEMFGAVPFAKGGIMTQFGAASLRKYANGGIATGPQVAMYGEGSMNEAYVPLPDGRTIPVTMEGNRAPIVNIYNQTGQQVQADTSSRMDGSQMVLDIVLSGMNTPGPFRDSMKNAIG